MRLARLSFVSAAAPLLVLPPCTTAATSVERALVAVRSGQTSQQSRPDMAPLAAADAVYATVLAAVATDEGLVRYDVLAEPQFSGLLEIAVQSYGSAALPLDDKERLAFLCNAYNANVLAMALRERRTAGFVNVLGVDGFFDTLLITVAGDEMTLNTLEKVRIKAFNDPRTHAALVCAAMSCPPLRAEPYLGAKLDEQMNEQSRRWLNDPGKNHVVGERLRLSRIFDWYASDFSVPPYGDVMGFVKKFADSDKPIGLLLARIEQPEIGWLEYDWTLNQAPIATGGGR